MSAALKIERVKLSGLTPDAANARLHDRRNLDAIKASLEAFGQTRPLVVTEAGLVLAGNGTLAAALELGWTTIDVTRVPFASEEEARAFALADNRTGELAQWRAPVLLGVLEELALAGWASADLGFEPHDMAALQTRDRKAPDEFKAFDEDLETEHRCPRCAYEWNGSPE